MKLITKLIISTLVWLLSIGGLFSQQIIGTWQGILEVQGTELEIVFHIEKQDSGYTSLMDSPTQGAFGIATTKTNFKEGKLEIVVANLGVFYQGKLENDSIKGTFNQSGLSIPLALGRSEKKELKRPQTPKAPFPYKVEEITFANTAEKIDLAGTLTLPERKEKVPAVILISGSGPNDRDETIFNHKPFWILADYLTRQGIAVLRYDKRGIGQSGGEYFTATTEDFTEDAHAAFNYLTTRPEIDASNIGLIGHSEGGVIAPIVAFENKKVKFAVLMAGLGVSGTDLVLAQHRHIFGKTSLTDEAKERLNQALSEVYASTTNWTGYVGTDEERNELDKKLNNMWHLLPKEMKETMQKDAYIEKTIANITSPWFRHFLTINPSEYLQKLSIPILAINGERDTQVDYETNLSGIENALKKGDNKSYTIKTYPRLNHLFQESTTGEINEYGNIEQTMSPSVLSDIATWIKQQTQ